MRSSKKRSAFQKVLGRIAVYAVCLLAACGLLWLIQAMTQPPVGSLPPADRPTISDTRSTIPKKAKSR